MRNRGGAPPGLVGNGGLVGPPSKGSRPLRNFFLVHYVLIWPMFLAHCNIIPVKGLGLYSNMGLEFWMLQNT
jgi:hypothetical protein